MGHRSKGIVLSYINRILNMLCSLLLSSFLLRTLGDTEYGIYQTVAAFFNSLVLLEFGMGTAMTRNISMGRAQKVSEEEIHRSASTLWTLTWLLSGLILLLSVMFYFLLPLVYAKSMTAGQILYGQKMFIPITGYLVLSFMVQTLDGLLLAYEQYFFSSLREILRTGTRCLVLILLLMRYPHAIWISVVDMLLSVVCLAASYRACTRGLRVKLKLGTLDRRVVLSSLPLCLALFFQTIVNQANSNVDKFLIGIQLSPESVSLYGVALFVFNVFSSMMTIPVSMYAPAVAQAVSKGCRGDALTDCLAAPCRLVSIIGGLILFGFLAVGKPFISLLYGQTYLPAWTVAIVLMVPMYLNMVNGVLVNVLDALNRRMSRSVALIITTVANIVLTVFWLERWGILGAALATSVCTMLGQVLLMNLYYRYALKIPVLQLFAQAFRGIFPYFLIGCLAAGLLSSAIPNPLVSLLAGGIVFVSMFGAGWYLFGSTPSEKTMIKHLLTRRRSHD